MAQVEIRSNDLKQLGKDFRQASNGKELRKAFNKQVSGVLRPVAAEVRAAYLAAPSHGHGSASRARQGQPDLRGLLAKSTVMQVRTSGRQAGVRIAVRGKKMPSGMRSLPRYFEGEPTTAGRGRWRHPVFGDRTRWVQQPSRRTFEPVVSPHLPQVAAAVQRARDEVARKLERKGGA
jgi:hypothetical protein